MKPVNGSEWADDASRMGTRAWGRRGRSLLCSAAMVWGILALNPVRAEEAQATGAVAALVEMSPGIYQMGALRLDQKARTLRLPASVNMEEGLIEYALVSPSGAKHESLLCTPVQAKEVHAAMLLLGAKGAPPAAVATGRPLGPIFGGTLQGAEVPQGDLIEVTLEWKEAGAEKKASLEDWIFRQDTQKAMEHGMWVYSGSVWAEGTFVAQAEGNLAAVVWNPGALINHRQAGGDHDEVWFVNRGAVPPRGTAVDMIVTLRRAPL